MKFNIGDVIVLRNNELTPEIEKFVSKPQMVTDIISTGGTMFYDFNNRPKNVYFKDSDVDMIKTAFYYTIILNKVRSYMKREGND